jgi:tetratricopeptide (TPR) repeat protein
MHRAFHLLGWGYVAACVALIVQRPSVEPAPVAPTARATRPAQIAEPAPSPASPPVEAAQWFRRVRPYCNPVEVQTALRQTPAPGTNYGVAYEAACYALAGRIDDARRRIDRLPPAERYKAVNVVFTVGHPVADAGDDRSAGPIMELVIDYWPNHYMALYHAGMAEYMLGQHDLAKRNLTEFLKIYREPDGWRSNAIEVLKRLDDPNGKGRELRRPREPGE